MEQRGRKSFAALSVVQSNVVTIPRPDPPPQLSARQAEIWQVIVNRHDADHFPPETHGELAAYCRHFSYGEYIAALIQQQLETGGNAEDLNKLLAMHERETRAASSLATRMRMTQQATMNAKTRKQPLQLPPPHER